MNLICVFCIIFTYRNPHTVLHNPPFFHPDLEFHHYTFLQLKNTTTTTDILCTKMHPILYIYIYINVYTYIDRHSMYNWLASHVSFRIPRSTPYHFLPLRK